MGAGTAGEKINKKIKRPVDRTDAEIRHRDLMNTPPNRAASSAKASSPFEMLQNSSHETHRAREKVLGLTCDGRVPSRTGLAGTGGGRTEAAGCRRKPQESARRIPGPSRKLSGKQEGTEKAALSRPAPDLQTSKGIHAARVLRRFLNLILKEVQRPFEPRKMPLPSISQGRRQHLVTGRVLETSSPRSPSLCYSITRC